MKKESKQEKKIDKAFEKLKKLYSKMPATKGCMENLNKPKEESCNAWCCRFQNPQVLYCEFLQSWRRVLNEWTAEDITDLLEAAMNNYLTSKPTKGCIFWNGETRLCKQHETRPYSCRIYGITPEEEFKPRYERLKVLYKNQVGAVIRDQCGLVSTSDGREVTTKDTGEWWKELQSIEQGLGISKEEMHDGPGGTYLTYHDHILLQVCSDDIMKSLQHARIYATEDEKREIVISLMSNFRKNLKKFIDSQTNENKD